MKKSNCNRPLFGQRSLCPAEYLVTTHDNRNLIVESDYFEHNNPDSYDFFTKEEGKTRSRLPPSTPTVFWVVEYEEAFKADFYDDGPNLPPALSTPGVVHVPVWAEAAARKVVAM